MTITIRPAVPDEAAALAELAAVTFPLACPPSTTTADIADFLRRSLSEDNFRAFLRDPRRVLLVAVEEGRLVGYTLLVTTPPTDPDVTAALTTLPTVELSKCYVHPDRHGAGLAARLMSASLARGAAEGAAAIWLGVNQENSRAIRFYEKSGFRKVGTKTFLLGSRTEHDFVMERIVGPSS
ncbi:MAG: acetyltransferase [Micrococcaceae bacterium]|nr:acetyltransferase [Micrococcaceae bacterium]